MMVPLWTEEPSVLSFFMYQSVRVSIVGPCWIQYSLVSYRLSSFHPTYLSGFTLRFRHLLATVSVRVYKIARALSITLSLSVLRTYMHYTWRYCRQQAMLWEWNFWVTNAAVALDRKMGKGWRLSNAAMEKCLFPQGNKNIKKTKKQKLCSFILQKKLKFRTPGRFSSGPSLCSNHHVHLLINLCASRKDVTTLATPTENFWPIKQQFLGTRQKSCRPEAVVPWWNDRSKLLEVPNQGREKRWCHFISCSCGRKNKLLCSWGF